MNINTYYVYKFTRNDTNEVCYIGKGKGQRWKIHEWRARNLHLANIINLYGVTKEKVCEGLSEVAAYELEIELISIYKRCRDGGTLCNLTLGGDGTNGYVVTEDHKATLRGAMLGKPKTKEHCEKISKGRKGIVFSEETKAKMRAAKLGRKLTEETKALIILARQKQAPRIGFSQTFDARQKISEGVKRAALAKVGYEY